MKQKKVNSKEGKLRLAFLLLNTICLFFSIEIQSQDTKPLYKRVNSIQLDSLTALNSYLVSNDAIYSVDADDNKIIKHSRKGEFIKRIGKKGRGPSEFPSTPEELSFDGSSKIALIDNGNFAVRFFSLDLEPHNNFIRLRLPASDIDFTNNGSLIVSYLPVSDQINAIQIYDKKNVLVSEFNPVINKDNFILNSFYVNSLKNAKILVTYRFRNLFQVYENTGKLAYSFKLPGLPEKSETKDSNNDSPYGKNVPTDLMFYAPVLDEDENIIIVGAAYSNNPFKTIYKIDKQGNLLEENKLEKEYGLIFYHNMKLYCFDSSNPNIIETLE